MKSSISIVPIHAFKDNYIWAIVDSDDKTMWVVDPGDVIPVIKFLHENSYKLSGILLTHHHADHSAGISKLLHQGDHIPVYASKNSKIEKISNPVSEGDEITCGHLKFTVMEIPGHTLDHVAFYNKNLLFCGDTLFSAGCGKVFEGTPEQMYDALLKIMQLPNETQIYCGHEYTLQNLIFAQHVEPSNSDIQRKLEKVKKLVENQQPSLPSTLKEEKLVNPFLRCDQLEVIQSVETEAKQKLKTPLEVFVQLRHWKNTFR